MSCQLLKTNVVPPGNDRPIFFFFFVPCCEPEQMRPRLLHLLSPTEQAGALRQGETVVNCKGARGKKGNW